MKNKKLLYIHVQGIQDSKSGGLNSTLLQVFSMCNAFVSAGYSVTLLMEKNSDFKNNLNQFINNTFKAGIAFDIKTWNKKHKNKFFNRLLVRRSIIRLVEQNKSNIIFTRDAFMIKDLVKFATPVVFESHNAKLHTRYDLIHNFFEKRLLRSAGSPNFKCLFSISEALSNYWEQRGVPKHKLFAWHDGFESCLFQKNIDKNSARNALNLQSDKIIVTYTGGLYPDREIDNIIYLARQFPRAYFLIIGGPEKNRQFYKQLAQEKSVSNINFVGFIEHNLIPHYLFASDILLALWSTKVPTINYCSPLKIFEYMAAGRTIVAHDFPTIREVLEKNVDAIFCTPGDFESLESALGSALKKTGGSSGRPNYGENARKKAFELYSWDTRVGKLLEFLDCK
jgi:glycosyltransferase involved in cell wall biosynthesis